MLNRDDIIIIKGYIPYKNKREKLRAWADLKKEFGEKVKILFQDNKVITYSATVNRNTYL